jgi:hypothetical protein
LAFHWGREADHSPPSSAKVKEWVELYIHSPNTPSWCGAQLGGAQGQDHFGSSRRGALSVNKLSCRLSAVTVRIYSLSDICVHYVQSLLSIQAS